MKTHRIYLKEAPGIWRDLGVDYTRPEAIATARQYRRDWPKRVYAVRKIHKVRLPLLADAARQDVEVTP